VGSEICVDPIDCSLHFTRSHFPARLLAGKSVVRRSENFTSNAPPQSMTRFCESATRLGRWASALFSRRSEGRHQIPQRDSRKRGRFRLQREASAGSKQLHYNVPPPNKKPPTPKSRGIDTSAIFIALIFSSDQFPTNSMSSTRIFSLPPKLSESKP